MSARKDDAGKPPLSLIPRSALLAEARVMAKGAVKYGAHNWRQGMSWSRLLDAAMRHLTAYADGQDIDDGEGGSGESHLANARCCLAFLIEYAEQGLGEDDRFKPSVVDADSTYRWFFRDGQSGVLIPAEELPGTYGTRAAAMAAYKQRFCGDLVYPWYELLEVPLV